MKSVDVGRGFGLVRLRQGCKQAVQHSVHELPSLRAKNPAIQAKADPTTMPPANRTATANPGTGRMKFLLAVEVVDRAGMVRQRLRW